MEKRFLYLVGVTAIALLLVWRAPVMAQAAPAAACASATQQVGTSVGYPYPVIICIADLEGTGQQKIVVGLRVKFTKTSTGEVSDGYQIGIIGKVGDTLTRTTVVFLEQQNR